MDIIAIDVETANTRDESICAVGVSHFADGGHVATRYWPVKPPEGFDWFIPEWSNGCHGMTPADVQSAPEFAAIAREVFALLAEADMVVAHNAVFDMRKLCGTAEHFGLALPPFEYLCTLMLARRVWPQLADYQLPTVASHIGYGFTHHHAGEDAQAAGQIFMAMMQEKGTNDPRQLADMVDVNAKAVGRKMK